jgi:hypothetical protein
MKRIGSNTAQNMFAVWLAYLLFLIVMHVTPPDDPWTDMLFQPVFLVIAPLLVACIPLLAARPERGVATRDVEDEGNDSFGSGINRNTSDTVRRMMLVWLVSLVVFASPHKMTASGMLDPILHSPAFLIVAPLLLACIPLLVPAGNARRAIPRATPPLSRSRIWKGIVACVIFAILAIGSLFLINAPSMRNGGSRFWLNIYLFVGLIAALSRAWHFVRLLKNSQ